MSRCSGVSNNISDTVSAGTGTDHRHGNELDKVMTKYFLFFVLVLAAILSLGVPTLFAQKDPGKDAELEAAMWKFFGNFIAVETGVIKNGEQIPLPQYQDGTRATRKECRYFVSPNEISTAMLFSRTFPSQGVVQEEEVREKVVTTKGNVVELKPRKLDVFKLTEPAKASFQGASFYIRCNVDANGYVHTSLWKHGWTDHDINVSEDRTYEELQEYYKNMGISRAAGAGQDAQAVMMKKIRETALVNYMVIALRTQPGAGN
ncbi:MAG: hypothetical protein A3G87_04350 [Omnitrophica bacterium RIFCSPLOWO2_12_FULL_50_11]|nr:MAG: hypothetical protein A3G87_04350 [Omnitrophica bacterium RIFCSPLOWO2_12_FULL_50_11]